MPSQVPETNYVKATPLFYGKQEPSYEFFLFLMWYLQLQYRKLDVNHLFTFSSLNFICITS